MEFTTLQSARTRCAWPHAARIQASTFTTFATGVYWRHRFHSINCSRLRRFVSLFLPAVCRCSALFLTLTKMLSRVPLFIHGFFHVCYHALFRRRQFCTGVRQPCIRELRQRQGTPALQLLAGMVAADVLPQVVKVWDCRQRDAVMQLPNWHSSVINTIKCVHAQAQCMLSNTLYQVPSLPAAAYNDVRYRSDSQGSCCSWRQPWAVSIA